MDKNAGAQADPLIDSEKQEKIKKLKSKKSVYMYIAALFVIVFLFILLSYFIQQRNNSALHVLNEKNATAQQNIENLQTTNIQLQAENDAYKTTIAALEEKVADLEEQVKDVKKQWLSDVQTVKENDAAQYNELLAQYNELLEKYEAKGNKK